MRRQSTCQIVHAYAACLIGILSALMGGSGSRALADDAPAAIAWLDGKAFQRQLQLPYRISWSDQALRDGLASVSRNQRIAIWLDRRIDPGRVMQITTGGESLQGALEQVAAKLNVGVGFVGPVVYLGPKPVAERLATIAALKREAVATLPQESRATWQRRRAFQWDVLTSPRELFDEVVAEIRPRDEPLKVVLPERLPHDLWAAGDYPALPPTDRLTLLLAGFDLSFDLARDGTAIRLAPLPDEVAMARTFTPDNALRAEQQVARAFPEVQLERRGNRLTATGRFEELELIGRMLRGEPIAPLAVDDADTRFDLKVENTKVSGIIGALKKQRDLTVVVDPAIAARLETLVTFSVEQVTLVELLEAALHPVGIGFKLQGNRLELRGKQAP